MSGGYFNYNQHYISGISDDIEELIETNSEMSYWGYTRNYSKETLKEFISLLRHRRPGDDPVDPDILRRRHSQRLYDLLL